MQIIINECHITVPSVTKRKTNNRLPAVFNAMLQQ
jgi:hypothetical protein